MKRRAIVAVSGGVDSIVLLDVLRKIPDLDIVVAHFDHGIRDDSHEDVAHVRAIAAKYGLPFETRREALGKGASEALARERRYAFLRELAGRYGADIYTAHHRNDAIETIAINLVRGTGWRGLAVLDSDVMRPLIDWTKQDILAYARDQGLTWREDSTNQLQTYLRNRLRTRLRELAPGHTSKLVRLRARQIELKHQIEKELKRLIGEGPEYDRHFFIHIDEKTALECLRYVTKTRLTRPQLYRLWLAIKTARAGTKYEAGPGILVVFTTRNFTVKLIK